MKKQKRYSSFLFPLIFILIAWGIKGYEWQNDISFAKWGIYPKTLEGLRGLLFSPFIHGDFNHLLNNTMPALVLGASIFFFYREVALKIVFWSWLMSGLWVWTIARPSFHIGASGVIYAMASFLFFSGVFRKHYKLMSISLLVVFLYGGMVWGVFPMKQGISWESHLLGAVAGIILAFYFRGIGLQRKVYDWELEEEEAIEDVEFEELEPQNISEESKNKPPAIEVNYVYKEEKNKE